MDSTCPPREAFQFLGMSWVRGVPAALTRSRMVSEILGIHGLWAYVILQGRCQGFDSPRLHRR